MSTTPDPDNLIDGTLYVGAVRADGVAYDVEPDPIPFLSEWDLPC